jgi:branched-chain amino acid aminotransferase
MSETDTVFIYTPKDASWRKAGVFPIPNRGMNFGDGLFETMVFDGEKIRFFHYHLDRLRLGMRILGITAVGADFHRLETWIKQEFYGQKLRIRWNLFRAGSGKYTPESKESLQTLHIQTLAKAPEIKSNTSFSTQIALFPYPWSKCKTLNALPYVIAAKERIDRNLDELVLLDYRGKVAEASSSNIFWRKGKKLFTPSLSGGAISGIGRRAILKQLNKMVKEEEFTPKELLEADQVWVSNVTGVSCLERIDFTQFSTEKWDPILEIFE